MGTMAIKEAFDWVIKDPKSVRASSTVIRISDDMASHKVLMRIYISKTLPIHISKTKGVFMRIYLPFLSISLISFCVV